MVRCRDTTNNNYNDSEGTTAPRTGGHLLVNPQGYLSFEKVVVAWNMHERLLCSCVGLSIGKYRKVFQELPAITLLQMQRRPSKLVDHAMGFKCGKNNKLLLKAKWVGYEDPSWEPESNLNAVALEEGGRLIRDSGGGKPSATKSDDFKEFATYGQLVSFNPTLEDF